MKKRVFSALMAAAMAVTSFVGLGPAEAVSAAETETVKLYFPTSGKFDDVEAVQDAVNEIAREQINVEVELHPYEFGQWFQQYSLFLSGTEDIDILANYGGYQGAVNAGAAYDLTELMEEYGQDIVAMEGDFLKSGQIDCIQYAIPIYAVYAWTMGIIYRKDVVEELGLTDQVAEVKTLADWTEVLAAVKEAKPDMTPFVTSSGSTTANFNYGTWDSLSNNYGVLMDGGKTTEVVNLFETEEYRTLCETVHDWYVNGYSSKDIQTQTDSFSTLVKNDAAFSTLGQADFNTEYYQSTTTGIDLGAIQLADPVARTYTNVTYTVMSNSKHAEASVKFMNLWFSNEEVGNLLAYGIEGTHYVLDENGMGTYPEGTTMENCGYHTGSGISNVNRIRWNSENPQYAELLVESNNSAQKSAALGFSFNADEVTNEITQLDNVCAKYQIGLECGALDPAEYLDKFNEELKAAGLMDVIAEKQAQIDAWK